MGPRGPVYVDEELVAPARPLAPPSTFRPDIQGLRALAVVLVIFSHAGVPGFGGGYVGVDVFFVISGFVITGLLLRQPAHGVRHNLAYFYQRRIRRIVPAATLTLVVTVVMARVLLGGNFDVRLLDDVRWAALFAANFRFIYTSANYFIPGLTPSLVTHFWSLGVEEQFYLCYPVIVFTLAWLTPARDRLKVLGAFLIGAVVLSAWWSAHLTHVAPITAYYSPFTRFWELALGGLVAVAPAAWARRSPATNSLLALVALVVLGLAVVHLNARSAYPGVLAWWPCAAAAVLLYTGQASVDISYSLYLWHYPWLMLPLQLSHPYSSPLARVVEVAGAALCAVLSYHFVENPIRHSRRLDRDPVAIALLLLVCVALTIVVTLLLAHVTPGA